MFLLSMDRLRLKGHVTDLSFNIFGNVRKMMKPQLTEHNEGNLSRHVNKSLWVKVEDLLLREGRRTS